MDNNNNTGYYLKVPGKMIQDFNLDEKIMVVAGARMAMANLKNYHVSTTPSNSRPVITLSPLLRRRLMIQPEHALGYKIINSSTIKLGPIVGVLVNKRSKSYYPLPTGRQDRIYREMQAKSIEHGILLYFFYASGVDWKNRRIKGHIYANRKNAGNWICAQFPLPDVVYNRISFRYTENSTEIKELLDKFDQDPDIRLFNTRFLNKWEVYDCLQKNKLTRHLVPETTQFSRNNLFYMGNKYPQLFIKPRNNSIGKGIIKVQVQNNGYLFCQSSLQKPCVRCRSQEMLYHLLKKHMANERRYIIQKGIDLATINKRIFDLRTLVQKDGEGKWIRTGVGVRVAARQMFVTHIPNGGSKAGYIEVINQVFGTQKRIREQLDTQLDYICQVVPRVLEDCLGLSLGVLSLDIGVDESGIMWVIEVNSKPASFDEDDIREKHLDYLNEYFAYIGGFGE